jgi:hypothetical protein
MIVGKGFMAGCAQTVVQDDPRGRSMTGGDRWRWTGSHGLVSLTTSTDELP